MSTRRWMIAVAVFALAMPVTRLESERSRKLSAEAERAGQIARYYQSRKQNTAANFYRARSQKYARAASPLRFLMLWTSD
ncbi:hypothetical protein [Singulisphaera sp. PoT]|uniref:hypothetical protein n=1 Tax=Singulisphaera sp. PoT TaxID=3411797 RepID=UPI003BF4DB00